MLASGVSLPSPARRHHFADPRPAFAMNYSGGVSWAFVGEIASSRLRSRTAGFSASVSVVVGIIFGVLVPYMINVNQWNWGLRAAFFFAGLSAIPIISCWFILPETKSRSPAELDELFEKKVRPWRMRSFVTETEQRRLHGEVVQNA